MKDIIKYTSLLILIVFSFYYTDKISTMIIYESDLMQEIISNKEKEKLPSYNAVISGKYIIPGVNGLEINELDSYYQMKKDYIYSRSKLVFNEVEPTTSLEQNKHLIINKGNKIKKAVAIIINNNNKIEEYCQRNNILVSKLIKYNDFNKDSLLEQINDEKDYSKLDTLLYKYKLNTNICWVKDENKEDCIRDKKYLVTASYEIDNIAIIGSEIEAGDIIYLSDDLSLTNFKVLLKRITYRDLDVIFLSDLISEKRSAGKQ